MTGAFTYTTVLAWAVAVAALLQRRTGQVATVEKPVLQSDGSYKIGLTVVTVEVEPGAAWTHLIYVVDNGANNWQAMKRKLVDQLAHFGKAMLIVHKTMRRVEKKLSERPGWSVLIQHQARRAADNLHPHVFQFHVEIDWKEAFAANYFPAPTPLDVRDVVRPETTIRETSYPAKTEYDVEFNTSDEFLLETGEDALVRWIEERVVSMVHGAISREGDEVNG